MNVHVLLAVGINRDGHREILGVGVSSGEDKAGWLTFFRGLVARGLERRQVGDLRRSRRPCGGDRRDTAWCVVATVPHALRGELDVDHPENSVAVGEDDAAFDL